MGNPDKNTLLFIADISGFTRFINETEITHSSHIISELLELVISENKLDLKIAEIEGDAVFFYKVGPTPSVEVIFNQTKKMFTAFHEHLKVYERDRICQCGACITASNLGLKFVTHQGSVIFQDIQGKLQLMGKDVTVAHKLLKNNIGESNYLLFTDDFKSNDEQLAFINEKNNYDDIGEVSYKYLSLENVKHEISNAPILKIRKQRTENPISNTITINAHIETVHSNLIDLSKRPIWKTEIKRKDNYVERRGTSHECLLPQGTIIGYVIDNEVKSDEIIYEEYTERKNVILPAVTEVYKLKKLSENSTSLKVELHIHTNILQQFLLKFVLKNVIKKGLLKFAELCEN